MKRIICILILLTIITVASVSGEELVSVEPVISNGILSFYFNSSDGSVYQAGIENLSCYAVKGDGIFTYDVNYHTEDNGISVNFRMFNCFGSAQTVCCAAALYRNGILEKIEFENAEILANSVKEINLNPMDINPTTDTLKTYVWDSISGMKPLGDAENIESINSVLLRKYVYVNCDSSEKFKLYINAPKTNETAGLNYIIEYDSSKMAVENLCAFVYPAVLECGYIKNAGINILEFSSPEGFVKYTSKSFLGLCGVNNVVEFSASENLVNEEITIIITK